MDTFSWLLLGHLVGDWVLQNNWMADGKRASVLTLPGVVHCAVYTAAVVLARRLAGYGDPYALLWSSVAVFVSHWVVDVLDVARHWTRLALHCDRAFVRLVIDQTLHLVVLAVWVGL